MKTAKIGNKTNLSENKTIRLDTISWIDEKSTNPVERIYLEKMERFSLYLNKTYFTRISALECHYAKLQPGDFYRKHVDQFKNDHSRKFSVILYLNTKWQEQDKGALKLFPQRKKHQEIRPVEGRLVFFKSDEMLHEVMPSFTRDRMSISGWLKE